MMIKINNMTDNKAYVIDAVTKLIDAVYSLGDSKIKSINIDITTSAGNTKTKNDVDEIKSSNCEPTDLTVKSIQEFIISTLNKRMSEEQLDEFINEFTSRYHKVMDNDSEFKRNLGPVLARANHAKETSADITDRDVVNSVLIDLFGTIISVPTEHTYILKLKCECSLYVPRYDVSPYVHRRK